MPRKQNKGFTLLEILLVIAAIGILAAIVLVAINPNRQLAQARNAQRRADINTIYKALEQYLIDTGSYPNSINTNFKDICNTGSQKSTDTLSPTTLCDNKADLRALVPNYVASIPTAPSGGIYRVGLNGNNRIALYTIGENNQTIGINLSAVVATGGDNVYEITINGNNYRVHEFRTVGTSSFDVIDGREVEYLIVGGGGGSTGRAGAGGGGVLTGSTLLSAGQFPITVGSGGQKNNGALSQGQNSSAFSLTALGGGRSGVSGGSGGGANATFGSTVSGASGTAGQGNKGGDALSTSYPYPSGGGGGAGQAGGNSSGNNGGKGGDGIVSLITGVSKYYGGGGGGGSDNGISGAGGLGGGGAASYSGPPGAISGTPNTGGGGGGNYLTDWAASGGSGIVIIRYRI